MGHKKIVSKKQVAKIREKFYSNPKITHDKQSLLDQHYRLLTKHPVRRMIVFIIASALLYLAIQFTLQEEYLGAVVTGIISAFVYYISIFGHKAELDDCIVETGQSVVDVILEDISDAL
jgi:hypothetical protein